MRCYNFFLVIFGEFANFVVYVFVSVIMVIFLGVFSVLVRYIFIFYVFIKIINFFFRDKVS